MTYNTVKLWLLNTRDVFILVLHSVHNMTRIILCLETCEHIFFILFQKFVAH